MSDSGRLVGESEVEAFFVQQVLRRGGWFPGREVDTSAWVQAFPSLKFFASAEAVLREFGGVNVQEHGPGRDFARTSLLIDPLVAWGEDDRFVRDESHPDLFPIGHISDGLLFLGVDASGVIYKVMTDAQPIGRDIQHALHSLILGRRL